MAKMHVSSEYKKCPNCYVFYHCVQGTSPMYLEALMNLQTV